jgi:cytosine/adenosine deaminase-related metal-dependent hydrolase
MQKLDQLKKIAGVRLPDQSPSTLWDITIQDGHVASVDAHCDASSDASSDGILDGANRLIAPSLCHAHIHLDKCFLLQDPKYSDLQIESGDFDEAMQMTGKAKSRFEEDDLLRRGRQLIEESIGWGVTAMRAFVEVDDGVQMKCLTAGLHLKKEFKERCDIQICAFAQLPLFSGQDEGAAVRELMTTASSIPEVDALGSTPYVEQNETKSRENVQWISELALDKKKYLDLHLDYFLEAQKQPLVWDVLRIIKELGWTENEGHQITLGHCTRLTLFEKETWHRLRQEIGDLPVSFVGLPTSDLFMMRTPENRRGTLPVVELISQYGLNAAIGVNNVGNAFTPYGNCDPMSIAALGVGLYQAGTKKDTDLLYVSDHTAHAFLWSSFNEHLQEAVSSRAKAAIGYELTPLGVKPGQRADFVLFDRMDSGWRCRKSIAEVVYDAGSTRQAIFQGRVTSH